MADILYLILIAISATATFYLAYRFLMFKRNPEKRVFTPAMLIVFLIAIVLMLTTTNYYFDANAISESPHLFAIDTPGMLFNFIVKYVATNFIIVIGIVYSFCKNKK